MDLNSITNNPEQIKQLISLLQQMLPENQDTEHNLEEEQSKIKTKSVRSDKITNRKNKFLDMPEKDMYKSDTKIDKRLAINPPTPRTRRFVPIDARCRVCGKVEKISPSIIPDSLDRYKCNRCSSSAGG
jgi:hypothetical protein